MHHISTQILSNLTIFMKYARFNPSKGRRETWAEIIDRNKKMHITKFPQLEEEIHAAYEFVYHKKVLPSMRSLQFAGKPIEINPARIYNCAYLPMNHPDAFSELMFLLLSGCGVGYSVQRMHVAQLPEIIKPQKTRRYLVSDSIEGWADAIRVLIRAYTGSRTSLPIFDFSDIRPKGALLKTAGGLAPGPGPLKTCIHQVEQILDAKEDGEKLSPLEVHDMNCHMADAVLSGGIRRSAMIALFSYNDHGMLTCKLWENFETNRHRELANNSIVLVRSETTQDDFMKLWDVIEKGGTGEPGFFFTDDKDYGINPCAEISLRANQFCNLVTLHAGTIENQKDLNDRARAASFIATLQASYTNFHYLRDIWKQATEEDALLGVSMTGIASGNILNLDLRQAAEIVVAENVRVANIIGVNPAVRCTTIKPEGTSSLVLGTSQGIHAWFSSHYLRRIRVVKNEAIYKYLKENHPTLIEDHFVDPDQAFIRIPIKAPEGAITRSETALQLLARVQKFHTHWIKPGHKYGANTHNISCFSGDTRFITDTGLRRFDTFTDGSEISVLNHEGKFVPATVKHFGKQRIWKVTVSNGQTTRTIRTTKHHWWFISSHYKRFYKNKCTYLDFNLRKTYELLNTSGTQLPRVLPKIAPKIDLTGLLHGIVYGDGSRAAEPQKNGLGGFIQLCADSRQLKKYFIQAGYTVTEKNDKDQTYIGKLPYAWKDLPDTVDLDYLYSFIAGWFAANGCVVANGKYKKCNEVTLTCKSRDALEWLQRVSPAVGIGVSPKLTKISPKTGYKLGEIYYTIAFIKESLADQFFVHPDKLRRFQSQAITSQSMKWWRVLDVVETDRIEDVYCVVEPENAAFVLEDYILTHNCTVTIKPFEWPRVGRWMWENRDRYTALATFPFNNTLFTQPPYEEIEESVYNELVKTLKVVDLSKIVENHDATNLQDTTACAGGACDIQ